MYSIFWVLNFLCCALLMRYAQDSSAAIPPETSGQLMEMHGVLEALKKRNLVPAER